MKSEKLLDYIGSVDDKYIQEIYLDMEAEKKRKEKVVPISRNPAWKKWVAFAAVLALVVIAGVGIIGTPSNNVSVYEGPANEVVVNSVNNSVVIIDVNPSIQLIVGDDGSLKSVKPLNEDASNLLEGQNFDGMDCQQAVDTIVTLLKQNEYLTPSKNSVLVSVVGSNDSSEAVKDMVTTAVEEANSDSEYELSILSQVVDNVDEYYSIGKELGISVGKTALIEDITSKSDVYDVADLASKNIHSLNQIISYMGLSVIDTVGQVAGSISEDVSNDLNISNMSYEDALDLALSMCDAYNKLCELNPEIDSATFTGYDFRLECNEDSAGEKVWTIIAENLEDALLPAVSIVLDNELIPTEVANAGMDMVQNSLKLACDVFGMIARRIG